MSDPYFALAEYYDSFTGNVDYRRRAAFLDARLRGFGRRGLILDAGCGTGELSRLLLETGYDVIGADVSESMLAVAREKNPGQLLLRQDLTKLDLYGTVQGVVCMQDTLNHLRSLKDFREALRRFSLFSEQGSRIVFDLNTEYKHRKVLADRCFVLEDENAFFVWQNETSDDGNVTMLLDLFRNEDERYRRESAVLKEILIPDGEVREALEENGLELLEVLDGDDYGPLREDSERAVYVTRKA